MVCNHSKSQNLSLTIVKNYINVLGGASNSSESRTHRSVVFFYAFRMGGVGEIRLFCTNQPAVLFELFEHVPSFYFDVGGVPFELGKLLVNVHDVGYFPLHDSVVGFLSVFDDVRGLQFEGFRVDVPVLNARVQYGELYEVDERHDGDAPRDFGAQFGGLCKGVGSDKGVEQPFDVVFKDGGGGYGPRVDDGRGVLDEFSLDVPVEFSGSLVYVGGASEFDFDEGVVVFEVLFERYALEYGDVDPFEPGFDGFLPVVLDPCPHGRGEELFEAIVQVHLQSLFA